MRQLKIAGGIFAAVLAILLGLGTYLFWPVVLDPIDDINATLPAPTQPSKIRLSAMTTGFNVSPQAAIYSGGKFTKSHRSVYSGFVIEHPDATFMLEGGIGNKIAEEHARNMNALEQRLFAFQKTETAKERMIAARYDPAQIEFIILTHLHWDHAAVIPEFPGTPIWTEEKELDAARALSDTHISYFAEHLNRDDTVWSFVEFDDKPYGPFDQSKDIFGDGSVVLIPLGGHTKGSIGAVVTTAAGKRYFFIGDVSWSLEAIKLLRPKTPFVGNMVDADREKTREVVALLHEVWKDNPDMLIVPTHDGPVVAQLSSFPAFE